MKKLKLSQKTQDYFWGIMLTISVIIWIWVVSIFI